MVHWFWMRRSLAATIAASLLSMPVSLWAEEATMHHAIGTFEVTLQPVGALGGEAEDGNALGRMSLEKTFSGGLQGKGSGEMLVDVVNGNLDFSFSNLPPVMGLIRKGSIRPIAVTSSYRSKQLPEVPTMAEQGVADFDVTSWLGLYGPAGMPPDVVQKLSAALQEGMALPQSVETLSAAGFEPRPTGADASRAYQPAGRPCRRRKVH